MVVLCQLRTKNAFVPYGICVDSKNSPWIASKGGIFRFDPSCQNVLFRQENYNFKQIAAFCSVAKIGTGENEKILSVTANESTQSTEMLFFNLEGEILDSHYLEGKVKSMTLGPEGDIFATFNSNGSQGDIYHSHLEDIENWNVLFTSNEVTFEHLCFLKKENRLVSSTIGLPTNMYSKQEICIFDPQNASIVSKFSEKGDENGKVYWPRCIQETQDGKMAVLDKTGRIQKFAIDGTFQEIMGTIPKFLGNGFCFKTENDVLITCSGVVENEGRAVCSDWIELLNI